MSSYIKSVVGNAEAYQKNRKRSASVKEISAPFKVALPRVLAFIVAVIIVVVISACLFDITPLEAANLATEMLRSFNPR